MGLFDSFNNIPPNYIPNNMVESQTVSDQVILTNVKPLYNKWDNQIGYTWVCGDSVNLTITVNKSFKVAECIVYSTTGSFPANNTAGKIGEKAYNTVDMLSWTMKQYTVQDGYVWVQDSIFTYDEGTARTITLTPSMTGKKIKAVLYSFRYEPSNAITYEGTEGSNSYMISLTSEDSAKIIPGTYTLDVSTVDTATNNESYVNMFTIYIA